MGKSPGPALQEERRRGGFAGLELQMLGLDGRERKQSWGGGRV